MASRRRDDKRPRFTAFDGFVVAGALVNVAVVLLLAVHWMTQ